MPRWTFQDEALATLNLALPAIATNALATRLQLVDASFLGHIGTMELAAASLGNAYFRMVWDFLLGVGTALDTLAARSAAPTPASAISPSWQKLLYFNADFFLVTY